jgi:hypothetical protein
MMFAMNVNDFILTLSLAVLGLGLLTFILGVIVILVKVMGKATNTIADETAKLAQKGITEEVAGLVGNASTMLDSLKDFVRTSAGMGIFLVMTGILLMAASFALITQVH